MSVYAVEDLRNVGIGAESDITVEREGRGDSTPPKSYLTRKQRQTRTTPFISPSISLSLKG